MRQTEIEDQLMANIVTRLNEGGYSYSARNFLLDVDEPYRAAILDVDVSYEKTGKSVGISQLDTYATYSISAQVPLSSTTETENRLEAKRIQKSLLFAIMDLERCAPVFVINNTKIMKAVVQDQYRSYEEPGALMLEIIAVVVIGFKENFN